MPNLRRDDDKEPVFFHYYEQVVIRKVHHFYLSGPIEAPGGYVDMIHKIQTAGPEDVIYIHLNTPGGQLDTGVQLINAMMATAAHVICSIESEAHSMATLIFLCADEYVVHDNCMMMFHNFSGAVFGKGHEQQAHLHALVKWFNTLARKLYIPFLSEEEFDRIQKGEDIYLHSDDIRRRLDKMVKDQAEKKVDKKVEKKGARKGKKKQSPETN